MPTSPFGDAFTGQTADGNATQHNGPSYINYTYNYPLRQRRSDETLRGSEKNEAFLRAVNEGQLPRVRNLLRLGADIDFQDYLGLTALHRAALGGHEEMAGILIEAGADINAPHADLGTPLCLAALKHHLQVVNLLTRYKARVNVIVPRLGTALHCSVWRLRNSDSVQQTGILSSLLRAGASVSVKATVEVDSMHDASSWDGQGQCFAFDMPRRGRDITPAMLCLMTKRWELFELLLPSGAELEQMFAIYTSNAGESHDDEVAPLDADFVYEAHEGTYLMATATTDRTDLVKKLIEKGACVDAAGTTGITALMLAAKCGMADAVSALLDGGASINQTDDRRLTALSHAMHTTSLSTLECLLARGATPDVPDHFGRTALHYAVVGLSEDRTERPITTGRLHVVQRLLEAGADVNTRDNDGYTPLLEALRDDETSGDILRALIVAGADTRVRAHDGTAVLNLCMRRPHAGSKTSQPIARSQFEVIGQALNFEGVVVDKVYATLVYACGKPAGAATQERTWVFRGFRKDWGHVLPFLISLGCCVELVDKYGETLLHRAARYDDDVAIDILIKAGASLESIVSHGPYAGLTPLFLATNLNNMKAVESLLSNGADPAAVPRFSKTSKIAYPSSLRNSSDRPPVEVDILNSQTNSSDTLYYPSGRLPVEVEVFDPHTGLFHVRQPESLPNRGNFGTDLATESTTKTDKTSHTLPEDGTPITITTGKGAGRQHDGQHSKTSLLIEYFEADKGGDKSKQKPSVRVRVVPSSRRRGQDAVQITGIGKDRKPSYSRRISLTSKHPEDKVVNDIQSHHLTNGVPGGSGSEDQASSEPFSLLRRTDNPKLPEMVEDTIKRMIMPEINARKAYSDSLSKEDFDTWYRRQYPGATATTPEASDLAPNSGRHSPQIPTPPARDSKPGLEQRARRRTKRPLVNHTPATINGNRRA